jgi:hypothetical protein
MVAGDHDSPALTRRTGLLRTVGLDLVGPLLVFQLCRRVGVAEVWSLVIAGVLPAVGVVVEWVRFRTVQAMGVVVLGGLALGVGFALISDDPKVVLLKDVAITAVFGAACLVSLTLRRPLIFHFVQAFYGGPHTSEGIELDQDYDRYREVRRFWRVGTAVWGTVSLAQATARVVVIQTTSTGTALTVNRTVAWVIFILLFSWMSSWGARLRADRPEEGSPSGPLDDALQ